MNKQFKDFKESVKHLSKEDLIRQLYLVSQTSSVKEIPWENYDPENPPAFDKPFIVYSDESNYLTFGEMVLVNGRNRWVEASNSSAFVPEDVTHYAEINLPGE